MRGFTLTDVWQLYRGYLRIMRWVFLLGFALNFVIFVTFPCLAQGEDASTFIKRGLDWLDLKEYGKARMQFAIAIELEPKNIEARYLTASSYFQESKYKEAIEWCFKTNTISPDHPGCKQILGSSKAKGMEFLTSEDRSLIREGFAIIQLFKPKEAIKPLRNLLKHPDSIIREEAEESLQIVDKDELQKEWKAIFNDKKLEKALRVHAAEELWKSQRYSTVVPFLTEEYVRKIISNLSGSDVILAKLLQFEWQHIRKALFDCNVENNTCFEQIIRTASFSKVVKPLLVEIANQKEKMAVEPLVALLMNHFSGYVNKNTDEEVVHIAKTLGEIGDETAYDVMLLVFSNYLTTTLHQKYRPSIEIETTFIEAFSSLTGKNWRDFVIRMGDERPYLGNNSFKNIGSIISLAINPDYENKGQASGSISYALGEGKPNYDKVNNWAYNISRTSRYLRRLDIKAIKVINESKVLAYSELYEPKDKFSLQPIITKTYVLSLRPNNKIGWYVDDVTEISCIRCGTEFQLFEDFPEKLDIPWFSSLIRREPVKLPQKERPSEELEVFNINTMEFPYLVYFASLKREIELKLDLPNEATRAISQGEWSSRLQFTLLNDGHLMEVQLLNSSGLSMLDNTAIRAIKAASPFRPFPHRINKKKIRIIAVIKCSYGLCYVH